MNWGKTGEKMVLDCKIGFLKIENKKLEFQLEETSK